MFGLWFNHSQWILKIEKLVCIYFDAFNRFLPRHNSIFIIKYVNTVSEYDIFFPNCSKTAYSLLIYLNYSEFCCWLYFVCLFLH